MSIIETLKQFKTILYGQKVIVYTDHQNLSYDNSDYSSDRVLRQRLLLEEYGAKVKYIKEEPNIVADSLSRLPKADKHEEELNYFEQNTEETEQGK